MKKSIKRRNEYSWLSEHKITIVRSVCSPKGCSGYVSISGGLLSLYRADLALLPLDDGTYEVVKDRYENRLGKQFTKQEVDEIIFLEGL